jgi:hypothetical protein
MRSFITLYSSQNTVRVMKSSKMRRVEHVERMGAKKECIHVLVEKPEGHRPLGRPRRRWEDQIKIYLREIERCYMDWIHLAQDRNQ